MGFRELNPIQEDFFSLFLKTEWENRADLLNYEADEGKRESCYGPPPVVLTTVRELQALRRQYLHNWSVRTRSW